MPIIKKVPAFQTPDGSLFEDEQKAARHMFDQFITKAMKDGDATIPSYQQLDVLWDLRFDLSRIILQVSTSSNVSE